MLTYEDALYHKMLLEVGVTDELGQTVERLLAEEAPLSDIALRLGYANGDPNEQLSALNEYLASAPEGGIDEEAVLAKLTVYLKKVYEADPDDLKGIADLMYRMTVNTGRQHDAPWQRLWLLGDLYDLVEQDLFSEEEYRQRVRALLYGEAPADRPNAPEKKRGVFGWLKKLLGKHE